MGITAKPTGKFRGMLRKIKNEEEVAQKIKNHEKGNKDKIEKISL